jgi:hypothetical protein
MNLYLRYFDNETLVSSVEDALDFLRSLHEIDITPELESDLREYVASDVMFPKRYKVRSHVYFIVIKTLADNMRDFKEKKAVRSGSSRKNNERSESENPMVRLSTVRPGWYEAEVNFKRVVLIPESGKHEYRDTRFVADCKADSPIDAYNRVVDYLRSRVDNRSQFPSVKGKNFRVKYLGYWK